MGTAPFVFVEGLHEITFNNGDKYQGSWKEDKMHG